MNIFQEMQMMAIVDTSTILDTRKELRRLVDFWRNQSWQQEQIGYFAKLRNLSTNILNKVESFMVTDDFPLAGIPEELRHDSLGMCKGSQIIYSGRYVFPIKDPKGNIMGFTGYDKFEEPKYLDSKNYGYKAKYTTFYGMEELRNYYESDHIFIVEGPICMLWLRQEGFNAVASLGSYLNPYAVLIFRRFGSRAIFIPDADEAGGKYERQIRSQLPQARILRPLKAKDVDDSRMIDAEAVKHELESFIRNPFFRRQFFR